MAYYNIRAYLDSYQEITVQVDRNLNNGVSDRFYLLLEDQIEELEIINSVEEKCHTTYRVRKPDTLVVGQPYEVMGVNAYRTPLVYRYVVKSEEFNREFFYGGEDLGAQVKNNVTTFKLWAPTASAVTLFIQDAYYAMTRKERGIFTLSFKGSLDGIQYRYLVRVNGEIYETTDPYGKAVTANGKYSVVYDRKPVPHVAVRNHEKAAASVIYEVSVRDYTEAGTFKAMAENLDYIRDLGVSHVELLPVNDFGSVEEYHKDLYYNWGYDPVNYQALEGSYSSDPANPLQVISDFKNLVNRMHENNLKVVLDVVFNHVYNASTSHFQRTVPYYYFRYDENGHYCGGTYCGNETASEMPMFSRYIIDTLKYYLYEYDVDGFRFDLMSFLDTYTMNQVRSALWAIKPEIVLYGEGWNMTSGLREDKQACMNNAAKLADIGFFDDVFRDTIKGSTFEGASTGYATGNLWMARQAGEVMLSQRFDDPNRAINYVQCHDNMTLYDKIGVCCINETTQQLENRAKLCNAMVIFSQGVAFLGAGQEFGLSKDFISDNYNSSDQINKLTEEKRNEHPGIIQFVRDCICLKKAYNISNAEKVDYQDLDEGHLVYTVDELTFIFNPSHKPYTYHFTGNCQLILNENGSCDETVSEAIEVSPISVSVLRSLNDQ